MGLVDKIASAIVSEYDLDEDCRVDNSLAIARAVLQAMREPDEAIIRAGFENYPAIWTSAITPEDRVGIWQAMIDAALLET